MAYYRQRGLRQLTNEVSTDGLGIGGGFIVGGVIGRQAENLIKKDVTEASPNLDKVMAWAANNGAKAAAYVLARKYDANTEITREATRALAGSIVYDTIMRLSNHGINPANVTMAGYRVMNQNNPNVQRLVQENSTLRTELNRALQRLASSPVTALPGPNPPGYNPDTPGFRYAAVPDPLERQKQFGSMPATTSANPGAKFGAMPYGAMPFESPSPQRERERKYGFSATQAEVSNSGMYGML